MTGDVESEEPATSIVFGARLSPSLTIADRTRVWISAGIGWGRMSFGRMSVREAGEVYEVRERAMSFAEVPFGVGTSFELIPSWLSIEIEASVSWVWGQSGEALEQAQAVDPQGRRRSIGALPEIDASFVQTIGLSLVL